MPSTIAYECQVSFVQTLAVRQTGKDYGCNSSLDSFYVITEILRQSKVKYLTSLFQNLSDTATIKV